MGEGAASSGATKSGEDSSLNLRKTCVKMKNKIEKKFLIPGMHELPIEATPKILKNNVNVDYP